MLPRAPRKCAAVRSLWDAMLDLDLFGRTFAAESFRNWRTVATVLEGLPLEPSAGLRQLALSQPPVVGFVLISLIAHDIPAMVSDRASDTGTS